MLEFVKLLILKRRIVFTLAKYEFRTRYLGSTFGVLWAFLLPLINLFIMWFAFQHGLRASPVSDVPFILWLVTGMFPWTFFSDAVITASNSIVDKSFLVKKIVFKVELLPPIKIIAAFYPFTFLLVIMFLLFVSHGFYPTLFWFQIIYYILCLLALLMSITWLSSSLVVFYRDLGQILNVIIQIGFWITPIFWSPDLLPSKFDFVTFLNPVNYIINGFRESLITEEWFWMHPLQGLYFWCLTTLLYLVGFMVFKKFRPLFADVL